MDKNYNSMLNVIQKNTNTYEKKQFKNEKKQHTQNKNTIMLKT